MNGNTVLDRLLRVITKSKVYIQMHNYPDQDAIASAFGLQEILRYKGYESVICYQGEIDKVNTIAMVENLEIEMYDVDDLSLSEEDEIILVDGQKGNTNLQELIADEIACIDHHPKQDTDSYRFYDIRKVGACATIIAEYFVENEIPISEKVATALVYGIKMDTSNLMRQTTVSDVDMFCYMYKKASMELLRLFESNSLVLDDLTAYRKALENLKIYGHHIGIANVGPNCSEAMMGTLSDFIMSLGEVEFSVVYSYRAGGLKLSLRSERSTTDAGAIVRRALSGYPGGGGGHAEMAGGFVPGLTKEQAKEVEAVLTDRMIALVAEYDEKRTNGE
ncbi:MAG: DHH family phosphoesterase [Lachnospiraceae bacterium]|nr:DHH family phosphoesterase [Lachnospiraceae bacterium]